MEKLIIFLVIIVFLPVYFSALASANNEQSDFKWDEGDVVTASATIVGLFGIGLFAITRFRSRENVELIMVNMKNVFIVLGSIEGLHLSTIGIVIWGMFSQVYYSVVIGLTIALVWFLLYFLYYILVLENEVPAGRMIDDYH